MKQIYTAAGIAGFVCAIFAGSMSATMSAASAQTPTAPQSPVKSPVSLSSDVKIERTERDPAGKDRLILHDPKDVVIVPGDNVVFTLNVDNTGAVEASGFRATNPIPKPVAFVSVSEDWADVSVDGGVTWGKLASLTVKAKAAAAGLAQPVAAAPEDVTHVRWIFADAIAPRSKTSVSYRGVVK